MDVPLTRIPTPQIGKMNWRKNPTLSVAIDTISNFIVNALRVFSHNIFDPIVYMNSCQKRYSLFRAMSSILNAVI